MKKCLLRARSLSFSAGTSHICCYMCFTCRYSPQHIRSSGYAANYIGPTFFIALLSTGYHSPSKNPPLVIASYKINSQLLALGNRFSGTLSYARTPAIAAALGTAIADGDLILHGWPLDDRKLINPEDFIFCVKILVLSSILNKSLLASRITSTRSLTSCCRYLENRLLITSEKQEWTERSSKKELRTCGGLAALSADTIIKKKDDSLPLEGTRACNYVVVTNHQQT